MTTTNNNTGTRDKQYNLISTVYHTIESATTYEQYVEDAKVANDNELVNLFTELKEHNYQMAEKAKQILKQRLD